MIQSVPAPTTGTPPPTKLTAQTSSEPENKDFSHFMEKDKLAKSPPVGDAKMLPDEPVLDVAAPEVGIAPSTEVIRFTGKSVEAIPLESRRNDPNIEKIPTLIKDIDAVPSAEFPLATDETLNVTVERSQSGSADPEVTTVNDVERLFTKDALQTGPTQFAFGVDNVAVQKIVPDSRAAPISALSMQQNNVTQILAVEDPVEHPIRVDAPKIAPDSIAKISVGMLESDNVAPPRIVEDTRKRAVKLDVVYDRDRPPYAGVAAPSITTVAKSNSTGSVKVAANPAAGLVPILNTDTGPLEQMHTTAVEEDGLLLGQHSTISPTATGTQVLTLSRTHAPQIASQIAMATVQSKAGTTEIALNPQELGRVRITLTTTDAGVSVAILAERPETVDLMRRNIDILAREFRELGHENLSFSFDDQSSSQQQDAPNGGGTNHGSDTSTQIVPDTATHRMTVALNGGLDLKL